MTASSKRRTFGINQFFRRQTNDSKYSHFSGSDEELLSAIEQNFPLREKARYEGKSRELDEACLPHDGDQPSDQPSLDDC